MLHLSYRQAKRLWRRYREVGSQGLQHGNAGRASHRSKPGKFRRRVLRLVQQEYSGSDEERFGPTLAAEHLAEEDGLVIDHETLRRWMLAEGLWSRRRRRPKHCQRRERNAHFGELVQLDGSFHDWLEQRGPRGCLMDMVDDATNQTEAQLGKEETIWAAVGVLRAWIEKHGIPRALYTDWKNYKRKATPGEQLRGEVPLTQCGRMCAKLGIRIIAASSPQAKGRVERRHGVHQDRLIKKMRRKGIRSYEAANEYLQKEYLLDHNRHFSHPAAKPEDYHGRKPSQRELREIFRLETERSISNDWVVRHKGRWLQLRPNLGRYGPTKSKALVCEWEDGCMELYYRWERIDYIELPQLPKKTPSPATPASRAIVVRKAKLDHPWRQSYKAIPTWPNRRTAAPLVGMRTLKTGLRGSAHSNDIINKKGDTLNELTMGTFLRSFDTQSLPPCKRENGWYTSVFLLGDTQLLRRAYLLTAIPILACLSGCGSSAALRISTQPVAQTVVAGQTATFSVTAQGSVPLSYQWERGSAPIDGATSASYTTPATTVQDNGAQFSVVVSNSGGRVTSEAALLTVNAATDVLTWHNDPARTGQNLTETILTTSNVNSAQFGKLGFYPVDGLVDAQPLHVSNVVTPNNGTHNLLVVATEHASVYALDAESGSVIWQVSLLKSGETTADDRGCVFVSPEKGVTATPVIDRSRGPNGAVYVVAMSKDASGNYYHRLHALDLALGTELFGGPVDIQATYPGVGDNSDGTNVIFDPGQYFERPALLLLNGVIYTSWTSNCDVRPYTGWIIGYSASTLTRTSVLNLDPNANGGAIWMSGAGLAADSSGNIYFAQANGFFDNWLDTNGFPVNNDYGNGFMKLSTSGGQLAVADFFEMHDAVQQSAADADLGSGGVLVLPDLKDGSGNTVHLAIGAGKDSNVYVVNRDSMGRFDPDNDNIYQKLAGLLPGGVWGTPAYFNNTVFYGPVGNPIQAFAIVNAKLSTTATAHTSSGFGYPGPTPSISANGTGNGIVWAIESSTPAILHAFDASNLNELYNSNQASGNRDQFGAGNKFMTPTVVNGRVFVGTPNGVAVFGLLPGH